MFAVHLPCFQILPALLIFFSQEINLEKQVEQLDPSGILAHWHDFWANFDLITILQTKENGVPCHCDEN